MVMRQRSVGRERPEERLALYGDEPARFAGPGRWAWAAMVVLAAVAAGATFPVVASADPPLGRAYELVSPADDPSGSPAGVASDANAMPGMAAVDGNALIYGAPGSIGDAINGAPNTLIFGTRDPDAGWSAETVVRTGDGGDTGLNFSSGEPLNATASRDASSVVFGIASGLVPEAAGFGGLYEISRGVALPRWLSRPAPGETAVAGVAASLIATPDLSTVAFVAGADAALIPDAPAAGVYVVRDGETELASLLPSASSPEGVPAETAGLANLVGSSVGTANDLPAVRNRNMLTRDGRFVLFVGEFAPSTNPQRAALYARDLVQNVTRPLAELPSGALRLDPGGAGKVTLVGRSGVHPSYVVVADDAPTAFFRGAPDPATPAVERYFEATLDTGDVEHRPGIQGPPVGVSGDGSKLLFLGVPPVTGTAPFELRFWDRDDPDESVLLGEIPRAGNSSSAGGVVRFVRSVDGGSTWVFAASGTLDPDNPNGKATALQVYRWSVGDTHPTCLSCRTVDGQARFLGVNMGVSESAASESVRKPNGTGTSGSVRTFQSATPSRSVTADGRIIAFDSPDRLVDADQNDVRDVYLWDADAPAGHELQIVTSGEGTTPSYFLDMDEDGRNVFFATAEGLVPADNDLAYDVYDARVGGGFPGSPASCVGEACRPSVVGPPALAVPGSPLLAPVSVGGQELLPSPTDKTVKLRVRKGKATSRRIKLKVRVPGAGRIRARGAGLRTASRRTKRATTYTVKIGLTGKSRRALVRRGRVRLRVAVRFTPTTGKAVQKTVKWTIKRSTRSSRKGR